MMFSDFVRTIDSLLSINPSALFILLPFTLGFWLFGKMLKAFVLRGHWLILAGAGLLTFAFASELWKGGNTVGALVFSLLLFFVGHEAYKRLTHL